MKKIDLSKRNKNKDMMLLANAFYENLMRDNVEYGGWGLDDKRPFGNSGVVFDIAKILDLYDYFNYMHEYDIDEANKLEQYFDSLYDELGDFLAKQWKKG